MTMETGQIAELARTVAALPQAERDFFDGLVANAKAASEREERVANLREMGDRMAVSCVLRECTKDAESYDPLSALQMLQEAGFVRGQSKQDEISIVLTMSDKSIRRLRGKEKDLQRLCQDLRAGREIVEIFPETEAV